MTVRKKERIREAKAPSKAAVTRAKNLALEWMSLPPVEVTYERGRLTVVVNGLETKPESNRRTGWRVDHERRKRQHAQVAMALRSQKALTYTGPPCRVMLTRLSAGELDDDNAVGALKAVRDAIARWFGVDDGPKGPITWRYGQRKRRVPGVEIVLEWEPASLEGGT